MSVRTDDVTLPKLLTSRDVCNLLGWHKATLYRVAGRDPTFPEPIMAFRERRWLAREIAAWIEGRPRRQYYCSDEDSPPPAA